MNSNVLEEAHRQATTLSVLRQELPVNSNWKFVTQVVPSQDVDFWATDYIDGAWDTVSLPHTPKIETAYVTQHFQGICWYRRHLAPQRAWKGKRVVLEFGAGMQIADVWVNGQHRLRHLGGYLPFSIDLSDELGQDSAVTIAVRLDNRDTPLCPPGKPLSDLDFSYFGGLYREALLRITRPVHVSDPLRAKIEAGGGVFVRCENVSRDHASVLVKTHVVNEADDVLRKCKVVSQILDRSGQIVAAKESMPLMITAWQGHSFSQSFQIESPYLWSPETPHLYRMVTRVYVDNTQTDEITTHFGIRHIALGKRFYLNGEEFRISGTNRHQEYPYLGNAVPKNAHRRDALKIKEAGFNFVRLSHYPQDPSFLDACDELGILVQAAIAGWQQFHCSPSFVSRSFEDIRELIRRDRNHPSIVFWEPNLNETGVGEDGEGHADWCRAAHEIAHAEYPGDQCFTFGDGYPPKPGWNWDVQGLWREYGDFSFGGNESTSRHTRGEGEAALLQQAWNYQWTFNHLSRKFKEANQIYYGCATWVMFDYNRGYYHKPCTCGMMDIFRLPKFVYYFYRSQRNVSTGSPREMAELFIANYWTERPNPTKVIVFSNCDEVALLVNNREVARAKPDVGADTEYSTREQLNLATVGDKYDRTGGNPYDGGNCQNIPHPPFTFENIPYEKGELAAIGYRAGKPVCVQMVHTPEKVVRLELSADIMGIPFQAKGTDAIFVRARLVDQNGTVNPGADTVVRFGVSGPARIVGPADLQADAGIATVLIQSTGQTGLVQIQARSTGLEETVLELPVNE